MKKIVKLTESDLTNMIERIVNESDRAYGHDAISKLYSGLGDDEHVSLDDSSGELSGEVVKKVDYAVNMLMKAKKEEDWSMVSRAISFLKQKF